MKLSQYLAIVSTVEKVMHLKDCVDTLTKEFPKYELSARCF